MFPDKCLVGLHNVANGGATDADLQAARVSRVEAVKTMTANPPEDVDKYRAALGPATLFVCRLYIGGLGDRVVSGVQAANDWIPDIERQWAKGVRLFEVHNEPNLKQEGWDRNWRDGHEFGLWFLDVRRILKARFPGILLGWPGLSPGGDVPDIRYNANRFLAEAKFAIVQADWAGAHCYEVYNTTDRGAGGAWRDVRDVAPNLPLGVTEFSSPRQTPDTQARQYRKFYEQMRGERNVFAVFSFCVYGDSFQHESWRTSSSQLTPIPAEVSRRVFPTLPAPTPKPYTLLAQPYDGVVDDLFTGATVRTLAGAAVSLARPGTAFTIHSEPFLIGGHAEFGRRVLVNRATENNVLVDRIVLPAVGAAPDRWALAGQALIAAFGANTNRETLAAMLAIGAAESGSFTDDLGDPVSAYPQWAAYACGGFVSFGWFQINAGAHFAKFRATVGPASTPCEWYVWSKDPAHSAWMAQLVHGEQGLGAWAVYAGGQYLEHMAKARSVLAGLLPPLPPVANAGFDAPIGTAAERATGQLWPGNWKDAWYPSTGYAKKYTDSALNVSYHTGADLNWNVPAFNADAHSPVYAAADGLVRFAGHVGTYWRGIVTLEHADGISTRYAHVEAILVRAGDRVVRGQPICQVGLSGGPGSNYHLHFDICTTGAILASPGHWPGASLQGVLANYVDPLDFIRAHRPVQPPASASAEGGAE